MKTVHQNIINGQLKKISLNLNYKNISQGKLKNDILTDYIPHKYIKNLSNKLKHNGNLVIKNDNRQYYLKKISKNLLKSLFNKFKCILKK